ncbi:MAG: hypothetical protein R3B51_12475 [Thermodesulfobacteriota bacterium]
MLFRSSLLKKTDCLEDIGTVGTFVDNFRIIETFDLTLECNGILPVLRMRSSPASFPTHLAGQFNLLPGSDTAGADVVLINFTDQYEPEYAPVPAFVTVTAGIWDEFEDIQQLR